MRSYPSNTGVRISGNRADVQPEIQQVLNELPRAGVLCVELRSILLAPHRDPGRCAVGQRPAFELALAPDAAPTADDVDFVEIVGAETGRTRPVVDPASRIRRNMGASVLRGRRRTVWRRSHAGNKKKWARTGQPERSAPYAKFSPLAQRAAQCG
jgi:hypothetical protein